MPFIKTSPCSWCLNFYGGNLDFPKIKKFKKVWSGVWTCTKMLKQWYFKQNYTLKLFFAFKMAYFCWFSLWGKSIFSRFPPKKVLKIIFWPNVVKSIHWESHSLVPKERGYRPDLLLHCDQIWRNFATWA